MVDFMILIGNLHAGGHSNLGHPHYRLLFVSHENNILHACTTFDV